MSSGLLKDSAGAVNALTGCDLSRWVVAWGWESTIDYRYRVTELDGGAASLEPTSRDDETSITPEVFHTLKQQLETSLGQQATGQPGGSPLLSALTIDELGHWNPELALPAARFWGIYPPALESMMDSRQPGLLSSYGTARPSIQGSLCIEDQLRSIKRMYSVSQGRRLDPEVEQQLVQTLDRLAQSTRGQGVVLGLGGLNKARPSLLKSLIDRFTYHNRDSRIVYVATNSFSEVLATPDGAKLLPEYLDLLRAADVVSLSAEEVAQLGSWLGLTAAEAGLYPLLEALDLPGLAVCHHRSGAALQLGRQLRGDANAAPLRQVVNLAVQGMGQYFEQGRTVIKETGWFWERARPIHRADYERAFGITPDHPGALPSLRVATPGNRQLTGLGSRFDGYLSALLPLVWDRLERAG